jgi:hypothetical protein
MANWAKEPFVAKIKSNTVVRSIVEALLSRSRRPEPNLPEEPPGDKLICPDKKAIE